MARCSKLNTMSSKLKYMLDSTTLALLTSKFLISALIFVRISGMFVTAQFFGSGAIPNQVKLILAIILTTAVAAPFWNEQPPIDFHLWNLVLLSFKEFLVGAIIGFSGNIVLWAARFAGGMIDFEMGFQAGALFDRDSGAPTLVGEFYFLTGMMIFLMFNGHHFVIESFYMSIKAVPLTTFVITQATVTELIRLVSSVLLIGMKIASPILIALFCTNLALALLARIAPQTNIFMLSFQVKISIGLVMLVFTVPLLVMVLKFAMTQMQSETMKLLLTLNPERVVG